LLERVVGWVALFIELDLLVVAERSITRPVLESIVLPELSIILVLGTFTELLLVTDERVLAVVLLLDTAVRVFVDALLLVIAERVEVLLDNPAFKSEDLFAELLL
jgi:hypothetical protein